MTRLFESTEKAIRVIADEIKGAINDPELTEAARAMRDHVAPGYDEMLQALKSVDAGYCRADDREHLALIMANMIGSIRAAIAKAEGGAK